MSSDLLLVAIVAYLAGALSVGAAILLGSWLREDADARRRQPDDLVSGELLAELLRGSRGSSGARLPRRPSVPTRRRRASGQMMS